MYRTTLHPHATRRHVRVTVVAIDLRRTRVSLVAGTEEPVVRGVPKSERTGLVPKTEFDALIAVFNGGWQTMHGRWGFMLNGRTFTKPRDVACTVALMKDDRLQIGPWPSLSDSEAQMKAYRQTPPCLIADGALHADLKGMQSSRKWGLSVEGKHAIRRSGVGLTASGDTLFYALGQETRAFHVATALQLVGARQAAELDINWIWTRFLIYEHPPDALPRIGDTLVKNLTHGKRWYVKYPQPRDFFYVTARP